MWDGDNREGEQMTNADKNGYHWENGVLMWDGDNREGEQMTNADKIVFGGGAGGGKSDEIIRRLERERDALRRRLAVAMKALREEGSAWPEQHSLNVALKQIEADDA
jgi:hypothetical protein